MATNPLPGHHPDYFYDAKLITTGEQLEKYNEFQKDLAAIAYEKAIAAGKSEIDSYYKTTNEKLNADLSQIRQAETSFLDLLMGAQSRTATDGSKVNDPFYGFTSEAPTALKQASTGGIGILILIGLGYFIFAKKGR